MEYDNDDVMQETNDEAKVETPVTVRKSAPTKGKETAVNYVRT